MLNFFLFHADFKPEIDRDSGLKVPVIAVVMIVISGCIILFLVLVILRMKGWLGGVPEDKGLHELANCPIFTSVFLMSYSQTW